jgi:hypothetical protein
MSRRHASSRGKKAVDFDWMSIYAPFEVVMNTVPLICIYHKHIKILDAKIMKIVELNKILCLM